MISWSIGEGIYIGVEMTQKQVTQHRGQLTKATSWKVSAQPADSKTCLLGWSVSFPSTDSFYESGRSLYLDHEVYVAPKPTEFQKNHHTPIFSHTTEFILQPQLSFHPPRCLLG